MHCRFDAKRTKSGASYITFCLGMFIAYTIASAQVRQLPQNEKRVTPEPGKSLYDSIKPEDRGGRIAMPFKSDRSVTVADVKELTRRSSDIIMGKPLINRSYLNERGDDIYSIHLVRVQSVIKGNIKNGSLVDLKTDGGAWMYSDETRVTRFPSDVRLLRQNASYFIFMKKESPDKREWIPALGIQSIFEMDGDTQSVIPCDVVETDPVVKKYKNAPIGEFVSEIIAAVAEEDPKDHFKANRGKQARNTN